MSQPVEGSKIGFEVWLPLSTWSGRLHMVGNGAYSDRLYYGQVAARLRNGFIREPSVAVEVESYRPFFILGEVQAPGQYPYVPNMTAESAVAIAGGFSPRARRDSVTLTHTDNAGLRRAVVPLGTPLGPGDTVLVGERWF